LRELRLAGQRTLVRRLSTDARRAKVDHWQNTKRWTNEADVSAEAPEARRPM